MEVKFKPADKKQTITASNEIQVAAFLGQGLIPATKADAEKLEELTGKNHESEDEQQGE